MAETTRQMVLSGVGIKGLIDAHGKNDNFRIIPQGRITTFSPMDIP